MYKSILMSVLAPLAVTRWKGLAATRSLKPVILLSELLQKTGARKVWQKYVIHEQTLMSSFRARYSLTPWKPFGKWKVRSCWRQIQEIKQEVKSRLMRWLQQSMQRKIHHPLLMLSSGPCKCQPFKVRTYSLLIEIKHFFRHGRCP